MTIARLLILQGVLLAGLSSIFLLPKASVEQPVGVRLELPSMVGEWVGEDSAVSEREILTLGDETEFARKLYTNFTGEQILVSIVLSGSDMNTSIHRPERCLPAQGWTVVKSDSRTLSIPALGAPLPLTRLFNIRTVNGRKGEDVIVKNLNYYWFVGATDVTASHFKRTFMDIRDRLLQGQNQRWAYITVSSTITKGLVPGGRSEAEVDRMLSEMIRKLAPRIMIAPEA